MKPEYRRQLAVLLQSVYPSPASELNFSNDFELLVAVVLSAQCTDKKVNEVTRVLFRRYPTPEKLSRARQSTVESIIRQVNYYKTKAKHLVALAKLLVQEHGDGVPTTYESLVSLPGVGNKTANVVLSELGVQDTFPVDTHVYRLAHRLGLSKGKTPRHVEEDLKEIFPSREWRPLHHLLILHGRRVCRAQGPKCESCLLTHCPSRTRPYTPEAVVRESSA